MNFYEKNNVVTSYLDQVAEHLTTQYHITASDAADAIRLSGLAEGIEGCPYIAMHTPVHKAAASVAKACLGTASAVPGTHAHASV